MNKEEFVKQINQLRRDHSKSVKNKFSDWYFFTGKVEGIPVHIKGYETHIQIFNTPYFKDGSVYDLSVKGFTEYLEKTAASAIKAGL